MAEFTFDVCFQESSNTFDTGFNDLQIRETEYRYQNSTNGTVVPTGTWTVSPEPQEGRYMWIRVRYIWNNETVTDFYSVSYIGANGTGSVNSVNGMGGNVIVDGRNVYVNNDAQNKETINAAITRLTSTSLTEEQYRKVLALINAIEITQ